MQDGVGGTGGGGHVEICPGSLGPTFREGGPWGGAYGRQTLPQDERLPGKTCDVLGPRDPEAAGRAQMRGIFTVRPLPQTEPG